MVKEEKVFSLRTEKMIHRFGQIVSGEGQGVAGSPPSKRPM